MLIFGKMCRNVTGDCHLVRKILSTMSVTVYILVSLCPLWGGDGGNESRILHGCGLMVALSTSVTLKCWMVLAKSRSSGACAALFFSFS